MTRAAAMGVACGLMAGGSAPLSAPPALPSATPAMTAIAVDLDADGHLDVATVVESGVAVASSDGRGGFHAPVVTPIRPLVGNGWFPRDAYLASGDVNGDGVLDLVQASMTDRCGADVLLGTGDGEFVLDGRYEVIQADSVGEQGLATNCSGLVVGDLDGDGRADVVLTHELYESDLYFGYDVFLAEEDGSLAAPVRHPLAGISVATGADMNGDGVVDLVVAAAGCDRGCYSAATQIEVHLADGAGSFLPPRVFRLPLGHDGYPQGFAIGDLDRDAYPDVAAVTSSGCCTEDGDTGIPMRWLLHNDGSGNLVLGAAAPALGASTSMRVDVLDLADVDGDGDDDLLGVARGLLWLEEAASPGQFLPPRLLARTPTDVVAPLAGQDVDGDGRADLVTSDALTGAPSVVDFQRFARRSPPLTLTPAPSRSGVGDLNGDGRDDLVVPTLSGVTVLLGAAGGRFEARSIDGLASVATLALADLDGDGALDLAGAREVYSGPASGSGFWVARGDGLGGFASPRFIEAGAGTPQSGSARLAVSDFEADGAPDLYLLHHEYDIGAEPSVERALLSAFGNDGQGQLSLVAQLQVPREFVELHAGDLDADGRGDALLAGYEQQLAWLPAPSGTCAPALNVAPRPPAPVRGVIDVNADGADDLVTDFAVHLNDGRGRFGSPLGFVSEEPPFFQTWPVVDDLDGDGALDLVRSAPDGLVFQRGLGDGRFAPPELFWPSPTLVRGVTLDLEGDGRRDLLVELDEGVVPAPRAPRRHHAGGR